MKFETFIEALPPGINETYGIKHKGMYKRQDAVDWQIQAALVVGSKAGEIGWVDDSKYYQVYIEFNNWRQDVDAPIKLVIDTLTQKLGFDDSRIIKQCSKKIKDGEKGIYILLEDWDEEENI